MLQRPTECEGTGGRVAYVLLNFLTDSDFIGRNQTNENLQYAAMFLDIYGIA